MPVNKKSSPTLTLRSLPSKLASSILNTPLHKLTNIIMYLVLLLAFLIIGYLFGKNEILQNGSINTQTTQLTGSESQQAGIQEPIPPSAEEVLAKLGLGHLPPDGNENAPVTIVEFSDFECPFCGRFYEDTLPQIREGYVDTGKVKIYYRHLPLDFHPKAKPLAIASECANDQGKFWEMHDKIFDNNITISTTTNDDYNLWAQELGLDTFQFNNCLTNEDHTDLIDVDSAAAAEVGATGTPTFFINGQQVLGAQPYASFKAIIDQELEK